MFLNYEVERIRFFIFINEVVEINRFFIIDKKKCWVRYNKIFLSNVEFK